MREVVAVVLLSVLAYSCLDHAAAAAVAQQETDRALAAALRAEEAARVAAAAAGGAEWAAVAATAARDAACACEWSMVAADPDYPELLTRMQVRCREGDECHLRWAWAAGVPPHLDEP